jgi:hypothetical protein
VGVLGTYSEKIPGKDFLTNFKNLHTCYLYKTTDTFSPFIHTPILVIEKAVFLKEGGFDPRMSKAEDFKLGAILGSKGYRFIIDRRIQGIHLKEYSLASIIKEDWDRIQQMKRIRLEGDPGKFLYKAHRWNRILALPLPGLTLIALVLSMMGLIPLWLPGFLLFIFVLLNSGFFSYARRKRGTRFALQCTGFLFLEMLWAEIVLLVPGNLTQESRALRVER